MDKLIVLTGMMGSGKTSCGTLLSKSLGFDFADIDIEIEKSENMSVSDIFTEKGEQYFRKLEKNTILKLANKTNLVISLGGGSFEDDETRNILKKNGTVFYLKATPEYLFDRIKSENNRPLLQKKFSLETLAAILKKRSANYEQAHYTIDTCGISEEEVVEKIMRIIE